eukprot:CAMPEP_0196802196 /NCGR_PEP_ID=MMETSP1362-20130617/1856_1 /TAXON_ID=163516 /ORGANISM="Leptocylindrus danicus, Strain CCMP1856" /LENGTH=681 /DNA_ID=CAMNT_0042173429 /DNA_START=58 /DNA_END=2103 /DNA_ORIENTATION=-
MPHLVYWYGVERGSPDAYSLVDGKSLMSYEEGKKKGHHKPPKKIQNKIDKGRKLTKSEQQLFNGLKQQEDDLMLRKAERIKWMSIVSYNDVHSNGEQHQSEGAEHVEIEPDHQEDVDLIEAASEASFVDDQHEDEIDDDDEGSYVEESSSRKRKIAVSEEIPKKTKKKTKTAIESKISKQNAKSKKVAAKKMPKVPEKVREIVQFNPKLYQHRLKQNEATFIPIMSILKSSIEKRDPKEALSGLTKLEDNLATLTVVFIENYLPGKFVGNVRRTFKHEQSYSDIVAKCKDIVKRLKAIYFELKDETPTTFKPVLGEGHKDCRYFGRSIANDNHDKTDGETIEKPSEKKALDAASVASASIKQGDKRINHVDQLDMTNEKKAEELKELPFTETSRSVSPVPPVASARSLMKMKSKANAGRNSSHPTDSSSNAATKAAHLSLSKSLKTPVSNAPKKALNLRSLINSVQSKAEVVVKKEDTGIMSQRDTTVMRVINKELPSWILRPAQRDSPKDEVRAFAVDFLHEALELRLLDERIIDKRGIALELEEAIHNWSEGDLPSGEKLDRNDKYWFKIHDVAACFCGKDELGMCSSDDEDYDESESGYEGKCNGEDVGRINGEDEVSNEDEEEQEEEEKGEETVEEESGGRNIVEEIMAGVFSTPMELVCLSRADFCKSFCHARKKI